MQLGKRINAAKSTISEYESEKHQLDPVLINTLCDLFDCTADYLICRSDARFPTNTPQQNEMLDAYADAPVEIQRAVDGLLAPYKREHKKIETA